MNYPVQIVNTIDKIGFFTPWIICSITAFQLQHQIPYFISFLFFYVVNTEINRFLKVTIKEERPEGSRSIINEKYNQAHQYGMPSCHAQISFYALTFFYLVKKSVHWTILMLFLTATTLYQRWKYRNHTIEQLGIGSIVGILIAFVGVESTKRIIQQNHAKMTEIF
jgi:membrane-associated phospholipid phosphatase